MRSKQRQKIKVNAGDQYKRIEMKTVASAENQNKGDQKKLKELKAKEIKGGTLPTWPVRSEGDLDPKLDQTFEQQHYNF